MIREQFPNPRCRDCKHCGAGRAKYGASRASIVCFKRPKLNKGYSNPNIVRQKRFYAVRQSTPACEIFEPKEVNE